MANSNEADELIGHLLEDMNCGNVPCPKCAAIRSRLADYDTLRAEVEEYRRGVQLIQNRLDIADNLRHQAEAKAKRLLQDLIATERNWKNSFSIQCEKTKKAEAELSEIREKFNRLYGLCPHDIRDKFCTGSAKEEK